jgi:hypothetical protein
MKANIYGTFEERFHDSEERHPHAPEQEHRRYGGCRGLIQYPGRRHQGGRTWPFTVFAPTDEAFKKLPQGALDALLKDTAKLKAVLSYHVIPGFVAAKDVKSGEVMTVQGTTLTAVVSSTGVQVNGAHVKGADIAATNGVIHVIDAVIMPKTWQLHAVAA